MWRSLAALARAALIEGKETNAQAKQVEEEEGEEVDTASADKSW